MFEKAQAFDQYIGDWDLSKVVKMNNMFSGATLFNKNVSKWDTSKVRDSVIRSPIHLHLFLACGLGYEDG